MALDFSVKKTSQYINTNPTSLFNSPNLNYFNGSLNIDEQQHFQPTFHASDIQQQPDDLVVSTPQHRGRNDTGSTLEMTINASDHSGGPFTDQDLSSPLDTPISSGNPTPPPSNNTFLTSLMSDDVTTCNTGTASLPAATALNTLFLSILAGKNQTGGQCGNMLQQQQHEQPPQQQPLQQLQALLLQRAQQLQQDTQVNPLTTVLSQIQARIAQQQQQQVTANTHVPNNFLSALHSILGNTGGITDNGSNKGEDMSATNESLGNLAISRSTSSISAVSPSKLDVKSTVQPSLPHVPPTTLVSLLRNDSNIGMPNGISSTSSLQSPSVEPISPAATIPKQEDSDFAPPPRKRFAGWSGTSGPVPSPSALENILNQPSPESLVTPPADFSARSGNEMRGTSSASAADNAFFSSASLALSTLHRRRRPVSSSKVAVGRPVSDSKKPTGTVPENLKDEAYWERRRKNNDAAKRSRDTRRNKEEAIAMRAALLEEENLRLKAQINVLKQQSSQLHLVLYNQSQQSEFHGDHSDSPHTPSPDSLASSG